VRIKGALSDQIDQPKLHSVDEVKESVAGSLEKLGFVPNLLLIHNPFIPADGQLGEFWGWLEDLVEDGTLKGCSLGVSNFRPVDIETVMKVAKIKPVVNRKCLLMSFDTALTRMQRSSTTLTL
jgi:diketogulonate reductase-like aldo/keto reductase